jgi:hypothetical protein
VNTEPRTTAETEPAPPPDQRLRIEVRSKEEMKIHREWRRMQQRKLHLEREYLANSRGMNTTWDKMVARGMVVHDATGEPFVGSESSAKHEAPPTA